MSTHMLDRRQYDPKMLTNVEVMSAYFVDLFYNHLYFEGKKLKVNGSVASVTEGYKHALNAFIKSLSNARLYKKAVIGIHQYFMNYTSFTTISFAKCVDRLASNFVPTDYYSSLNNTQKMSILRLVINQAVKNFTKKVVNEHLGKIIDNHKETDNVRLLQDELIDCFLLEREGVYQRFVATQTKTNTNETVNRLIAEKMQKEIKKLILEKIQLKKENAALRKIILKNSQAIERYAENTGTLESTINEMTEEIKRLKTQIPIPPMRRPYIPDNFSEVSPENLKDVLRGGSVPSPTHSVVSDPLETSAFIQMDAEPAYSPATSPKPKNPHIQQNSPEPSPEFAKEKELEKNNSPKKEFQVPKKKRPSANLGDGVTLDDFY